jgi:hypothetical protein
LVVKEASKTPTVNFFSFLSPFSDFLWLGIIAVIVINGVSLATYQSALSKQVLYKDYLLLMYKSFCQFTEADSIETDSVYGKVLNVGFSFFVLITLAAYTASYSSALLDNNSAEATITSVDDMIARSKTACVARDATIIRILSEEYPTLQYNILDTVDTSVLLHALRKGLID